MAVLAIEEGQPFNNKTVWKSHELFRVGERHCLAHQWYPAFHGGTVGASFTQGEDPLGQFTNNTMNFHPTIPELCL